MKKLLLALLICAFALPLGAVTWPIKMSANGRYFVDANGVPFLMSFDTDHAIIGKVPTSGYQAYLDNRKAKGFNGINIFGSTIRGYSSGAANDGTPPFTVGSGPSGYVIGANAANLNNAYWSKVDALVTAAAADGLVVLLCPLPAQYYDGMFNNNGATAVFQLGAALGTRYKNHPNLIWHIGNDCNTCNLSLQQSFLDGILSTDPNHLTSFQYNAERSYTNQANSSNFASKFNADFIYSYYESYDYALHAYQSSPTIPCFLGEADYEGGNNTGQLSSNTNHLILRMEDWWTVTSGCPGYVWGNESVNHNDGGYPASMDTKSTSEVINLPNILGQYKWWNLVPDAAHAVVTAGYGSANPNNRNLYTATYATTAWITDGSLSVTYTPVGNNLVVAMSKFAGSVTAKWFDPSTGTSTTISGSPFAASGTHTFATPGKNADGDPDWVLVLEAGSQVTKGPVPPVLQITGIK
jgi:hypothetical protein